MLQLWRLIADLKLWLDAIVNEHEAKCRIGCQYVFPRLGERATSKGPSILTLTAVTVIQGAAARRATLHSGCY